MRRIVENATIRLIPLDSDPPQHPEFAVDLSWRGSALLKCSCFFWLSLNLVVNFVNIKQELFCYVQQNFASFGLFVLQNSGVTPLKYGEIYDTDFVANFMENTTIIFFWKSVMICQTIWTNL